MEPGGLNIRDKEDRSGPKEAAGGIQNDKGGGPRYDRGEGVPVGSNGVFTFSLPYQEHQREYHCENTHTALSIYTVPCIQ